jgi:hypothetical protein
MMPKVIPADVVHPKSAFLVKDYILDTGIARAHNHFVFTPAPRLGKQFLDDLSSEPLSLPVLNDSQINYLAWLAMPTHRGGANNLTGSLNPVDRIA